MIQQWIKQDDAYTTKDTEENMKVVRSSYKYDSEGYVIVRPEESEDLWHLYNLVFQGDLLRANTFRKVQRVDKSGAVSKEVKRTTITLCVKSVEYDAADDILRVSGRNVEENPFIALGQHHTLEVQLNNQCTLYKKQWDMIHRERLEEATDPHKSAEITAVLIDTGVASLYLITSCLAKNLCRITVNIPRRRAYDSQRTKAQTRFFTNVLTAMRTHINFDLVKCCLIAGPGFTKDEFYKWMMTESIQMYDYVHMGIHMCVSVHPYVYVCMCVYVCVCMRDDIWYEDNKVSPLSSCT
eukprot:GHVQ01030954.1.p1 GENE.GHVQ01030954.1~~GHVQ01030954.1.p1  ORF type:complete len:296 (+),score=32.74 GHVQ01030954.1:107-994(+)